MQRMMPESGCRMCDPETAPPGGVTVPADAAAAAAVAAALAFPLPFFPPALSPAALARFLFFAGGGGGTALEVSAVGIESGGTRRAGL